MNYETIYTILRFRKNKLQLYVIPVVFLLVLFIQTSRNSAKIRWQCPSSDISKIKTQKQVKFPLNNWHVLTKLFPWGVYWEIDGNCAIPALLSRLLPYTCGFSFKTQKKKTLVIIPPSWQSKPILNNSSLEMKALTIVVNHLLLSRYFNCLDDGPKLAMQSCYRIQTILIDK